VLFIRSPWGQSVVVKKATSFVSINANTTAEIEKLAIPSREVYFFTSYFKIRPKLKLCSAMKS
jgi:hypothetical protein